MPNYRVHFPIQAVVVNNTPIHGVQSVSMTTNFSLEQVFELGQLEIYENIENVPDIELTIERVLDGYPLLFVTATSGSTSGTLVDRTNQTCDIHLLIYPDSQEFSEGMPISQVTCSGMYISTINYTFPVEGNATESLTFVGNDKVWAVTKNLAGVFGSDSPADEVQRRQHVNMGGTGTSSIWPTLLPGIDGSGHNLLANGQYAAHIQDVSITINLNREDLFELGRRKPYYRYANFPVTVETTINMTAGGDNPGDQVNAISDQTNLSDEEIIIRLSDGSVFNLGDKNKLSSVSQSGGDTGGGVVNVAYTFQNFNVLTVTSPS